MLACAPEGGDALEAGEAGYAVGALGVEGVGRGVGGGGGGVRVAGMRVDLALVAVFDGCG